MADSIPLDSDAPVNADGPQSPEDGELALDEELPRWLRVLLLLIGAVFLLIGLVMLALPVLPQVWAFALAAVCFSLASETIWRHTESFTRRWPRVHAATCRLRTGLLRRLPRRRRRS